MTLEEAPDLQEPRGVEVAVVWALDLEVLARGGHRGAIAFARLGADPLVAAREDQERRPRETVRRVDGTHLLDHNVARFTSTIHRHPGPVVYYLPILLGGLFVWSGLTVPGLAAGSVEADLAEDGDLHDPPPLIVRATPERLSATVLTGGTTLWLLQSGFWTYLLILGLPLWRHVDLLPIVDSPDGPAGGSPGAADADDERAVARVIMGRGWSRRGRR